MTNEEIKKIIHNLELACEGIKLQTEQISELKSEISILTDANKNLQELYREEQTKVETAKQKVIDAYKKLKTAKSEAIKEFAEKLKSKALEVEAADYFYAVAVDDIDELMKAETEEVVEVV